MDNLNKNEALFDFMALDLGTIKKEVEKISGSWNGEDEWYSVEGKKYPEEAAACADETIGAINKLKGLLEELSNY
jgi:hypothetical protein